MRMPQLSKKYYLCLQEKENTPVN
uniref:Uncharacterized protein n=1 Tax=Rhizophora mucronata TaxID=61149 RepID=A0A2P2NS85_RHIMU